MQNPQFNVGDVVKYDTNRGPIYRMRITKIESKMNGNGQGFFYSGEIRCMARNKETGKLETFSFPKGTAINIRESMLSVIGL